MSTTTPPMVSVLIPCRNESRFIRRVLEDVVAQDYPCDLLEVFVLDGMSSDDTPAIIQSVSASHPFIQYIPNEARIVPPALNKGIRMSKGDIIVRLDAHASYPAHYISGLVRNLQTLHADNVGGVGITQPASDTLTGRVIAAILSHPFGVGNSLFRTGVTSATEADTVPFGCFRRDVFDRFGMFDERLIRNQDIEFNKRIKAGGGKIFLVPDVHSVYYARSTFPALIKNNFQNGRWILLTAHYTGTFSSLSVRHFIPLFFTLYLLLLPVAHALTEWALLPWVLYALLDLYFSAKLTQKAVLSRLASRSREGLKEMYAFPLLFIGFILLHISYGTGCIKGLWDVLILRMKK